MSNNYITRDCVTYSFSDAYKQHFFSKVSRQVSAATVLQQRQSGYISDLDLEVIKFINSSKYVTADILAAFLGSDMTTEKAWDYLEKLCRSRFITKFFLESLPQENYPKDALDIYCLDIGGNALLENFDKPSYEIETWYPAMNLRSAAFVSYYLTTANFYANLRKNCKNKISYFKTSPIYRVGKTVVSPTFELCIEHNGEKKQFIGLVVRGYDLPTEFRTQITNIESIVGTNAWKKYFYGTDKAPTVLVIAEDDSVVKTAALITHTAASDIKNCRYTTIERCRQDMAEPGVFLKFNDEKESLVKIRINVFSEKTEDTESNEAAEPTV